MNAVRDQLLPNGLTVAQLNPRETAALYEEIFVGRCYLRNAIVTPTSGVVVDVGANIGLATLFFHCEAPRVPIIAVEPARLAREALEANVRRFDIRAEVFAAACGREPGTSTFSFYPGNSVSSGLYPNLSRDVSTTRRVLENAGIVKRGEPGLLNELSQVETFSCEVLTLSEILDSVGVKEVGLLKIDAERAEQDVLLGIRPDHWAKIAQVVLEVHDGLRRAARVRSLLEARGMHVTIAQDPLIGDNGENLLYARHPD
jgi:31-O-methyltransferase